MSVKNPFQSLEKVDQILTAHREKVINGEYSREKFLKELQDLTIFANAFPDVTENSKNWILAVVNKQLNLLNDDT